MNASNCPKRRANRRTRGMAFRWRKVQNLHSARQLLQVPERVEP
jgi:hypothetical protein